MKFNKLYRSILANNDIDKRKLRKELRRVWRFPVRAELRPVNVPSIAGSFIWMDSPQGQKFWAKLDRAMRGAY